MMYFADAMEYLGWAAVLIAKRKIGQGANVVPLFAGSLWVLSGVSILALILSLVDFERVLRREGYEDLEGEPPVSIEELAPAE